eukprot:364111-Chlamydomonas_euryale.AAC.11
MDGAHACCMVHMHGTRARTNDAVMHPCQRVHAPAMYEPCSCRQVISESRFATHMHLHCLGHSAAKQWTEAQPLPQPYHRHDDFGHYALLVLLKAG